MDDIFAACEEQDLARVKAILAKSPGAARIVDDEVGTPLHLAVTGYEECARLVDLLVQNGADVNAKDSEGRVPLHGACVPKAITALVKAGAKIDALDHEGNTPLMLLTQSGAGDVDAVSTLIKLGADVTLKNKAGQRALDLAMETGDVETIEFLERRRD